MYTIKQKKKYFYHFFLKRLLPGSTRIFQPIYRIDKLSREELYSIDYVKNKSMEYENGLGNIFLEKDNKLKIIDKKPTSDWIPIKIYDDKLLYNKFSIQTLELQNYFVKKPIGTKKLSKSNKNILNIQNESALDINDFYIKHFKSKLNSY